MDIYALGGGGGVQDPRAQGTRRFGMEKAMCVSFVSDTVSEKYLNLQFSQFGSVTHVTVDRERGHALIYFEQVGVYFTIQAVLCTSLECDIRGSLNVHCVY
jgi:hypothetical protein